MCGSLGGKEGGSQQVSAGAGVSTSAAPDPLRESHPVEASPLRPGREFSFCLWASSRVRLVLKSGTSFGRFLSSTLPLCRDTSLDVASALFPLPLLPYEGLFRKRSRRRTVKLT